MIFLQLFSIAIFATGSSTAAAFIAPSTTTFVTRTSLSMSTAEPAVKIDPLTTAFVFIEYQNEFTTEGGALHDAVKECMHATGTLGNSRKAMDAARDAGCVIIHVPIAFEKVRSLGLVPNIWTTMPACQMLMLLYSHHSLIGTQRNCKELIWNSFRNQGGRTLQSWGVGNRLL